MKKATKEMKISMDAMQKTIEELIKENRRKENKIIFVMIVRFMLFFAFSFLFFSGISEENWHKMIGGVIGIIFIKFCN